MQLTPKQREILENKIIQDLAFDWSDEERVQKIRDKYNDYKFFCFVCKKYNIDMTDFDFTICISCEHKQNAKMKGDINAK